MFRGFSRRALPSNMLVLLLPLRLVLNLELVDIVATYAVVVVVDVCCGLGNNMESLQYGIWLVAATMPGEYVACSL